MRKTKVVQTYKSKKKNNEFSISPVRIKRNKFFIKGLCLNYKKNTMNVKVYPTLTLDPSNNSIGNRRILGERIMVSGKRKINVSFTKYNNSRWKKFSKQNYSKILKMSNCVFQIFAINENLTECHFSVGTIVKLTYQEQIKLVLITHWENFEKLDNESEDKFHFYCTNNKNNQFLKFFEQFSKFNSLPQRKELFSYSHRYGLYNLELNNLFLNIRNQKISENFYKISQNISNNFLLFEASANLCKIIDFVKIPTINLNEKNIIVIKNKLQNIQSPNIILTSFPLNFRNSEINKNNIQLIFSDNFISYDKLSINYGELQLGTDNGKLFYGEIPDILKFKGGIEYGSVGSLVFFENNLNTPIGINVGASMDRTNLFIPLQNAYVCNILREYLLLSLQNVCIVR